MPVFNLYLCSGDHPEEAGQGYGDWAGQNTDSQGQWEDKEAYKESAEEGYEEEEEEDLEDEEEEYDEGEEMAESFFVDTVQPPQKKQKVGEIRDKGRGQGRT